MKTPELTILLLTYNNEDSLQDTLNDLATQTFSDFHLEVVDDCSSDQTRKILLENKNRFTSIKFVFNEKNKGVLGNLRDSLKGIRQQLGRCQYFHWACPDDRYDSTYFEKLISVLKSNPAISAVQSHVAMQFVNEGSEKVTQCRTLASDANSSLLFKDQIGNLYQPYNQFIHGVSRAKEIASIYQIEGPFFLYRAIVVNELFIVALLKMAGALVVIDEVLHAKRITTSFEKRYPNDSFTRSRASLVKNFSMCLALVLTLKDNTRYVFRKQFYVSVVASFRLYFISKLRARLRGV